MSLTGQTPDGKKRQVDIAYIARAGFPAHSAEYVASKKAQGHGMRNLNDEASGMISTGYPAPMANGGQLNPAFSLYLQGYPTEWLSCAPSETPSSLKSRQSSSGQL
jgi:hypothetical protein